MATFSQKWHFFSEHAWPSAKGLGRLLFSCPVFCVKLLALRGLYFFTGNVAFQLSTPDAFTIKRDNELKCYWRMFVERDMWHPSWINAIKDAKQPSVLDVGANAGVFSHLIYSLNHSSRITAFEPLPVMAQYISIMAKQTGANITVVNKAVSDKFGESTLFASSDNDVNASLCQIPEASMPFKVSTTTLDAEHTYDEIFMAKIDVEGLECAVIDGGINTLSKTRFLLIEALSDDAFNDIKARLGKEWKNDRLSVTDYFFERTLF